MPLLCCFGSESLGQHGQDQGAPKELDQPAQPRPPAPPPDLQRSAPQDPPNGTDPGRTTAGKAADSACHAASARHEGGPESSIDQTSTTSPPQTVNASPAQTPVGTGDLAGSSTDAAGGLPIVPPLSPLGLFQELGNLTYLGQVRVPFIFARHSRHPGAHQQLCLVVCYSHPSMACVCVCPG